MTRESKSVTTHTPGPWAVREDAGAIWIDGDLTRHEDEHRYICTVVPETREPQPEDRANARLIAAAPEMLAALKTVQAEFTISLSYLPLREPFKSSFKATLEAVNAAIARAEGRGL